MGESIKIHVALVNRHVLPFLSVADAGITGSLKAGVVIEGHVRRFESWAEDRWVPLVIQN